MNGTWKIFACVSVTLLATALWCVLARVTCAPRVSSVTGESAVLLPVAAGVIGWRFADDPALPAWWWAGLHTVPLAVVDLRQHRLPRWWLASFAAGGVFLFTAVPVVDHESGRLMRAMLAAVGMWLVMRVVECACGGRMGGGDTRLHAVLALYTGWVSGYTVVLGFLAGSTLLGITAGVTCLSRRRPWSSRIAAGPSLLAGAWLVILLSGP